MDIERLAEKAHEAWKFHQLSLGVADHPYEDASIVVPGGVVVWCRRCGQIPDVPRHKVEMRPWGELTEVEREPFRVMVGAVMAGGVNWEGVDSGG